MGDFIRGDRWKKGNKLSESIVFAHGNTIPELQEALTRELITRHSHSSVKRDTLTLIDKQKEKFGGILDELLINQKKIGHWAWWVWPTEMPGGSEPPPKTSIASEDIPYLLEHTDTELWTLILKIINEVGVYKAIPGIDHGRIIHFYKLFMNADINLKDKYKDFFNEVNTLSLQIY